MILLLQKVQGELLEVERVLHQVSKQARQAQRKLREDRDKQLLNEPDIACRTDAYENVWQVAYRIACKGKGPKHRNFRSLSHGQADIHEWRDFLAAPAVEGGMEGIMLQWPESYEQEKQDRS